jgi:hypothetical protein
VTDGTFFTTYFYIRDVSVAWKEGQELITEVTSSTGKVSACWGFSRAFDGNLLRPAIVPGGLSAIRKLSRNGLRGDLVRGGINISLLPSRLLARNNFRVVRDPTRVVGKLSWNYLFAPLIGEQRAMWMTATGIFAATRIPHWLLSGWGRRGWSFFQR